MSNIQQDIQELSALKEKFKEFVHGGLDQTVTTDSGTWPSIPRAIQEATEIAVLGVEAFKNQAETAAASAQQSEDDSALSATQAETAAASVSTSAQAASDKATEAAGSATSAIASSNAAGVSETAAEDSKTAAYGSETKAEKWGK